MIYQLIIALETVRPFLTPAVSAFLGAGIASAVVTYYLEEKRRKSIRREEATEAVSELLAEWIKPKYAGDQTNESRWKLQALYWKTILRLDKNVLDILTSRFANQEEAMPTNQVIVTLRQALLGLKNPDMLPGELNNWPPK